MVWITTDVETSPNLLKLEFGNFVTIHFNSVVALRDNGLESSWNIARLASRSGE